MPWAVTLIVKNCGTMAPLQGVQVSDGYGGGGVTDVYGQFIGVLDDIYTSYIVQLSKAGFDPRPFTFDRSQAGTVQNTCLNVHDVTTDPPPSSGPDCFIVTAATGSPASDEVVALRALRDEVAARAPIAGRLIDAIYDEYWQFSPAVADEIRDDETSRMAVMTLVVKPLLAWYEFAGKLSLSPEDTTAVTGAGRELQRACPRYLQPAKIAGFLARLAKESASPESMPALVRQLAPRLQQALALPLVRWAIFEPLQRAWQGAADRLDMQGEVAHWLAGAPVDAVTITHPDAAADELHSLASLLAFDAEARAAVGTRLAKAWPDHQRALQEAGLLDACD